MAPTLATTGPISFAKPSSPEPQAKSPSTTNKVIESEPAWDEILGSKNWDGLLDNPFLRNYLVRWGRMAEVTYDAFNDDKHDPEHYGACRYSKEELLTKTNFPYAADYNVVDLLYATAKPWIIHLEDSTAKFQGYIAVSTDDYTKRTGRREIYVAWRGTETINEWLCDIHFPQTPVKPLLSPPPELMHFLSLFSLPDWAWNWLPGVSKEPRVADAWYDIYTDSDQVSPFTKFSARAQLIFSIRKLVQQYKDEEVSIICVGHSLGGTLAALSAFDIVKQGLSKKSNGDYFPVTAVLFACPRVGNKAFMNLLGEQPKLNIIHARIDGDIVPELPLRYMPLFGDYSDIGVLKLLPRKSPFYLAIWELHDLKLILKVLAGGDGEERELQLFNKRNMVLLNTMSGLLTPEHVIPPKWLTEKNKRMVMNENGEWVQREIQECKPPEVPSIVMAFEQAAAAFNGADDA